jgi:hypothetical protein
VRRVPVGALLAAAIALASLASPGMAATGCGGVVTVTGPLPCYKARSIVKEFKKTRKHKIQGSLSLDPAGEAGAGGAGALQ